MESINPNDHLNFSQDKEIRKIILSEKFLYSNTIIKINSWNMSQERNIIITDKAIYNIKKKSN